MKTEIKELITLVSVASSFVSALVSYMALKRDDSDVELNLYVANTFYDSRGKLEKSDEIYLSISATNLGRRSVALKSIGGSRFNKSLNRLFLKLPVIKDSIYQLAILDHDLYDLVQVPGKMGARMYKEGETVSLNLMLKSGANVTPLGQTNWKQFGCLYVKDTKGRYYYLPPRVKKRKA